ncbi:MAG: transcriptional regulator [Clostridiales bacterium]|nr:transcriptional regulator [Clostridiales bacterium]
MQEYCQSCGMPMNGDEALFGREADGGVNQDYCKYCYERGAFTGGDCTMDQMIEVCAPFVLEGNPNMTKEQATEMMRAFFPQLKRWQTA